ncbi:TetR/AcrR family transcriptional regulator [Algivirga pacifica]|uniref:TetR/AcrR family transcriptional regulator n=1 Tax=Algivirga pacifica TaxID=1162670 RepID=A0ABP9DHM5_9BACT
MSKGIDTRSKIIMQSARLFNRVGYHACALSDIMKATGLKKGGIYNHFSNKDEIAEAAFDYNFNLIKKTLQERLFRETDPREKIEAILDTYAHLERLPEFEAGCPIFNTAVDASNTHPKLKEKAKQAINHLKTYIIKKIEEGMEQGIFQSTADKEAVATMMLMTMEGALVMSRVSDDRCIAVAVEGIKSYLNVNLYQ